MRRPHLLRRHAVRTLFVALVIAAVAAVSTTEPAPAEKRPTTVRFGSQRFRGRPQSGLFMRRLPRHRGESPEQEKESGRERRNRTIQPGLETIAVPALDPATAPTLHDGVDTTSRRGRALIAFPPNVADLRTPGATFQRLVRAPLHPVGGSAQSSSTFDIYRDTRAFVGSSGGASSGTVGEPSVANDRHAILQTGNWYAAVSADDGLTFTPLNPNSFWVDASGNTVDGGFCCDQLALAVDRGSHSLIFWLMQGTATNPTVGGNRLRLLVFDNADSLLAGSADCMVDIHASDAGFPSAQSMDFEEMAATSTWLYITTNGKVPNDDVSIVRMRLSDLESCGGSMQHAHLEDTGTLGLVQGASSTMYFGEIRESSDQDTHVRVRTAVDSGTSVSGGTDVDVTNTPDLDDGDDSCSYAGDNPCSKYHGRLYNGVKRGSKVTFLWGVAPGSGLSHAWLQHVTVNTSDLSRSSQGGFAGSSTLMYPGMGVNVRGDIGMLWHVASTSSNMYPVLALADSSSGEFPNIDVMVGQSNQEGPNRDDWGDYQTVRAFGDCTNTYLGTYIRMESGGNDTNSSGRMVWFGRDGDGCPDLVVDRLDMLPRDGSPGEHFLVADTTRNIGSGTAGASETRFYLSRDTDYDTSDRQLDAHHPVSSLAADDDEGQLELATVPSGTAAGTYYLLACADDDSDVSEITNTNNCRVAESTFSVPFAVGTRLDSLQTIGVLAGVVAGASKGGILIAPGGGGIHANAQLAGLTGSSRLTPVVTRYSLVPLTNVILKQRFPLIVVTTVKVPRPTPIPVVQRRAGASASSAGLRVTATGKRQLLLPTRPGTAPIVLPVAGMVRADLRVPRSVPRGAYRVEACAVIGRRDGASSADDCLLLDGVVRVVGARPRRAGR